MAAYDRSEVLKDKSIIKAIAESALTDEEKRLAMQRAYHKVWRAANIDHVREYARHYRRKLTPEQIEHRREYYREWSKANRGKGQPR